MPNTIDNKNLFLDTQFQQFVDFAEAAAKAGKQRAVARVETSEVGGIANRTIRPGSGDWTATVKTDGAMSTTPIVVHE